MTADQTNLQKRRHLEELYATLRHEVECLAKAKRVSDTEPTFFPDPIVLNEIERRVLVRSIFAFIEAVVFGIKMFALDDPSSRKSLSRAEVMIAEEEEYQLDDAGNVVTRPARLRFLSNIRFAFKVFAKVSDADFNLDVRGVGWQSLQRALKIRDRLMHPKKIEDLNVSDDEVREALQAWIWFENQVTLILIKVVRSLQSQRDRFRGAAQL